MSKETTLQLVYGKVKKAINLTFMTFNTKHHQKLKKQASPLSYILIRSE